YYASKCDQVFAAGLIIRDHSEVRRDGHEHGRAVDVDPQLEVQGVAEHAGNTRRELFGEDLVGQRAIRDALIVSQGRGPRTEQDVPYVPVAIEVIIDRIVLARIAGALDVQFDAEFAPKLGHWFVCIARRRQVAVGITAQDSLDSVEPSRNIGFHKV